VVFALARLLPGDPCVAALQERANPTTCATFNARYGLDQPIPAQFWIYLTDLSHGDLGDSISQGRPVSEILIERLPVTIELTLFALTLATVLGITLGVLSASRRNSAVDVGTMIGANIGVSTPVFVLGLILIWVFAVLFKDGPITLPPGGRMTAGVTVMPLAQSWGLTDLEGPLRTVLDFFSNMFVLNSLITGQWGALGDAIRHLILPAVALGLRASAVIARLTRAALVEILSLDYVRIARSKGLPGRMVVFKHALRNALIPIVTVVGLQFGNLLSGAVIIESVFGRPGLGSMAVRAILFKDFPLVQGTVLVLSISYVFVNLLVDLSYAWLNPQIRLGH